MIDIFDKLNAAYGDKTLADSDQIKDKHFNKKQEDLNKEILDDTDPTSIKSKVDSFNGIIIDPDNAVSAEKSDIEVGSSKIPTGNAVAGALSDAVLKAGVFDISAYNLTEGKPTPYVDITAALGNSGENVPVAVRKGGMQVKFIQGSVGSSDNKYVQYRLMAQNFTTDVTQWQGVDDDPTAGGENLIKSGGAYNNTYRIDNLEKAIQKENNLFDYYGDTKFLQTWIETDGATRYAAEYNATDYLFVKGASKFISNTYIRRILFYNESQSVIQCINNGSAANTVVDIHANAVYMRLVIAVSVWTSDVIVNIGNSVSTNKVPYKIGKNVDIEELDEFKQEYEGSKGYTPTLTYTPGFAYIVQSSIETDNPQDHSISNVISLAKGETIHAYLNAYGPSDVVSALCECDRSGNYVDNLVSAAGGNNYQTIEYTANRNMYVRLSYYDNSNLPVVYIEYASLSDISQEIVNLSTDIVKTNIITVGTGKDFTSIVDAINSITDSGENNRYEVDVYEGTYDTIDASAIDANYVGLLIPDWVSIVGIGNRDNIILTATCPSEHAAYANNISTVNFMANGEIDNVTIIAKNLRYCNHDDSFNFVRAKHTCKNVKFVMQSVDSGYDVAGACVGIGAQKDKEVIFYNCEFENANSDNSSRSAINMHDETGVGYRGMRFLAECCKFSGGYHNVVISNNQTTNPLQNFANFLHCIWTKKLCVTTRGTVTANVFKIKACGNKDFDYIVAGNLSDISNDIDIY